MSKYIATKLHKAAELAPGEEFFTEAAGLPHYVIDETLIELLQRSDVGASISAMIEAGICKLPFPQMLIEVDMSGNRSFVVAEEYQDHFRARMGIIHKSGLAAEVDPDTFYVHADGNAITVDTVLHKSHSSWLRGVGLAISVGLLMLNIQGVDQEVIEPTKLNKRRVASGHPGIPRHTLLRIGHVYDSDGSRHASTGSGWTMPVHLRAAHTRRQHFGEGNLQTKIVYVPPVLVNFTPGAVAPQPRKIVAA